MTRPMKGVHVLSRLPLVALGGLAVAGLAAGPAAAADVPVNLACQATPPIGSAQTLSLSTGVDGTAPATATAGSSLTVTLAPDAITVPTAAGGHPVKSISDIRLTVPVPAGATLTDESLSGGSGLGPGTPSVSVSGGALRVTVPGPIAGGATFTLPVLTLRLTAGAAGTTVQTRLGGTGFSDPGLTFDAAVDVGIVDLTVPTSCYPSPSPALTTTAIG